MIGATSVAIVLTILQHYLKAPLPSLTATPFSILGMAISIFLGFRNNTAYNRFWEARTLWGRLINTSRDFARQILTLINTQAPAAAAFREDVVMATVAYAHSLRHHLRGTDPFPDISERLTKDEVAWLRTQNNVAIAICHLLGRRLAYAREQGWVRPEATLVLEGSLSSLTDVQGGCERIRNTPVPATYTLLSHHIVLFFCYLLPLGILDAAKVLTPVVVFLVSYALFGLDALGEEITEPFGNDPHDLPLEGLCATIESNLKQILSEKDLPSFQ